MMGSILLEITSWLISAMAVLKKLKWTTNEDKIYTLAVLLIHIKDFSETCLLIISAILYRPVGLQY